VYEELGITVVSTEVLTPSRYEPATVGLIAERPKPATTVTAVEADTATGDVITIPLLPDATGFTVTAMLFTV
jgi:hypothetical protein